MRARLGRCLSFIVGAAVLLAFQCVGEASVRILGWPVPGPVIGMLLLWAGLCLVGRLPSGLERCADRLLAHLMLPLIPAIAAVGEHAALLRTDGLSLLAVCIAGIPLVVVAALWARGTQGPVDKWPREPGGGSVGSPRGPDGDASRVSGSAS